MSDKFEYKGDLVGGPLMIRECRIISELLLNKLSPEAWGEKICNENVLQKRTTTSAKRNAYTIRKRLSSLEPQFLEAIVNGDDELATQAVFCGVLNQNLLLIEFIETVLADAYSSKSEKLDFFSWSDFIEERSLRDRTLRDLKESTKNKIRQVVFRILADVGYIKSTRNLLLQNVLVRQEIKEILENTNKIRIKRCLEVSV